MINSTTSVVQLKMSGAPCMEEFPELDKVEAPKHCSFCNIICKSKNEFDKHVSLLHKSGEHECEYCYKRFKNKHDLSRHEKTEHFEIKEESKCHVCEKVFKDKRRLDLHDTLKHSAKTLLCDMCDEKFSVQARLDIHKGRKHLRLRNFPCPDCPKKFFCMTDVRTHITQVHSEARPFKCDICPAEFKRNSAWRSHRKNHLDSRNFQCPICQKKFKHKNSVSNCMRVHEDPERKLPCTVEGCDVALTTNEGLKKHIEKHGNTKRYPCTICTKTLSGNSELLRHIRFVHGNVEKKYECTICSLKCVTRSILSQHLLTHNGDVFHCKVEDCTSKANTQYGLNYHFKKKHGKIKHRRPVEEIKEDQDKRLECSVCEKTVRAGPAPNHSMKLHMKTHENQSSIDCPKCDKKILFPNLKGSNSYQLPVQFYNHLETSHQISFQEFEVKATFWCKICQQDLILKSSKTSQLQNANLATTYASTWGDKLKGHITKDHQLSPGEGRWAEDWNYFYERKNIAVEKKKEPTFIVKLLSSKKCELNCDFEVTDRWASLCHTKLLKHYSTDHFGPKLLEQENKYFKTGRFTECLHCGFEIKQDGNLRLNTKAVHIGLVHNEIENVLQDHFQNDTKSFRNQQVANEPVILCHEAIRDYIKIEEDGLVKEEIILEVELGNSEIEK